MGTDEERREEIHLSQVILILKYGSQLITLVEYLVANIIAAIG